VLTGERGLIENQIKDWVRRNVCLIDKENGRCHKLLVRHLTVDKKPDADVHTVTLTGDPSVEGTEIADRVILDVAECAQRDANDLGGIQNYAVYAYYTNNKTYVPRKVFRVASEDDVDREREGTSEPPTEKGLVAQLMRHNEINTKNSLVAMGYILQTFQKEIGQQREQNRIFLNQQIDMTILVQEVLNDSSKRRIEEKSAEIQVSMIEGVFEHLKVGLPILINRLAGKEVFPARMDRELYMMATLFEGLAPEQQAELTNMLRPEQLSILGELLGMYEERKHKFLKKHGEEPEEAEEEDGGKNGKTNGHVVAKKNGSGNGLKAVGAGTNKLLQMFERRRSLVNSEKAIDLEDQRTRRIERKAQEMKDKLKDVKATLRGDDENK
jgi:hypothetical protein